MFDDRNENHTLSYDQEKDILKWGQKRNIRGISVHTSLEVVLIQVDCDVIYAYYNS